MISLNDEAGLRGRLCLGGNTLCPDRGVALWAHVCQRLGALDSMSAPCEKCTLIKLRTRLHAVLGEGGLVQIPRMQQRVHHGTKKTKSLRQRRTEDLHRPFSQVDRRTPKTGAEAPAVIRQQENGKQIARCSTPTETGVDSDSTNCQDGGDGLGLC